MPSYRVELTHQAEKIIRKMAEREPQLYIRISRALAQLAQDPSQGKPLIGELKGRWSLRVGSYRIIYLIQRHRLVVVVIDVGHRREIYR